MRKTHARTDANHLLYGRRQVFGDPQDTNVSLATPKIRMCMRAQGLLLDVEECRDAIGLQHWEGPSVVVAMLARLLNHIVESKCEPLLGFADMTRPLVGSLPHGFSEDASRDL